MSLPDWDYSPEEEPPTLEHLEHSPEVAVVDEQLPEEIVAFHTLIPFGSFDRQEFDSNPNLWAFECDGEPVEVSVGGAGVFFNEVLVDGDLTAALLSAYAAFGEFEFLGVLGEGLGIALVTRWKGSDMIQHIASVRTNAAAQIGLYLREDGWGERVYLLPALKTMEEKSEATAPVYYNCKAPYGGFYRLDPLPALYGEDGSHADLQGSGL